MPTAIDFEKSQSGNSGGIERVAVLLSKAASLAIRPLQSAGGEVPEVSLPIPSSPMTPGQPEQATPYNRVNLAIDPRTLQRQEPEARA